jgi:MscS family membrane protein
MNLTRIASSAALLVSSCTLFGAEASQAAGATAISEPDLIEQLVDMILARFGVTSAGNTPTHWAIFGSMFVAAWVLRKFVTTGIFAVLKHFASKTETTLDDKLFPALEGPVKGLVFVVGSYAAVKVLKLSVSVDTSIGYLYKIALPCVIFWGVIKAISAIVDHLGEMAEARGMGIAAFLPLLKKTIIIIFIILAGLTIVQSFGYDVKTFLAGLGIGGLAFALAAQDTIANLFGSFVIALDQPFKVGEIVRIGSFEGTVEGIGMRSTKLRTAARTLIAIPNKSVANEAITNFSRMPQRRVEQTLGLTYDTTLEQLKVFMEDVRALLKTDPGVDQKSIVVNFVNYGDSSLDVQVVYFTSDPDFTRHLELRERINLKIMQALVARGLSFAYPTHTLQLDGPVAKALIRGAGEGLAAKA